MTHKIPTPHGAVILEEVETTKHFTQVAEVHFLGGIAVKPLSLFDSVPSGKQLTPREIECITLSAVGLSRQETAASLGVSLGTVKTHTLNAYGRLGTCNSGSSLTKLFQIGILSLERPIPEGGFTLTPSQAEVIWLLSQGYVKKQIAGRLCLSPKTIESHLRNAADRNNLMRADIQELVTAATFARLRGPEKMPPMYPWLIDPTLHFGQLTLRSIGGFR